MEEEETGLTKVTEEEVLEAIERYYGKTSPILQALGITRSTYYRYRQKWPSLEQAITEAQEAFRERRLDLAERNVEQALLEGHWPTTRYVLGTAGQERGYGPAPGTNVQVAVNNQNSVNVNPYLADPNKAAWHVAEVLEILRGLPGVEVRDDEEEG